LPPLAPAAAQRALNKANRSEALEGRDHVES